MTDITYAPCPTCGQYSHSIGEDSVAAAYRHFTGMIAHPVRAHPMSDAFDEQTQRMAKVLCDEIKRLRKEEG